MNRKPHVKVVKEKEATRELFQALLYSPVQMRHTVLLLFETAVSAVTEGKMLALCIWIRGDSQSPPVIRKVQMRRFV